MRVLLATDGSQDAKTATEWLGKFPLSEDTTVSILTVAAPIHPPVDAQMVRDLRDAVLADARRTAEVTRKLLEPRWPDAGVRISEGDPRDEIVRVAEEWGADLVVVGARGVGAVKGFVLGSVSLALARHAPCPVLVVKGPPRELGSVLVALDGSEGSLQALTFLASLPLPRELRVRLLSVMEPLGLPSSAPRLKRAQLKAVLAKLYQEWRTEVEAMLGQAAAGLEGKVDALEGSVSMGQAAEEINAAAREHGVDLIVVGARGLGGLKRLFLGSVSEKVLRYAQCPVLIVKRS